VKNAVTLLCFEHTQTHRYVPKADHFLFLVLSFLFFVSLLTSLSLQRHPR
jgi:hypothetical protein